MRGAGDPENDLQVAQATRTFLAVGLQAVRSIVVARVPFGLFELLGLEKSERIEMRVETGVELVEQRAIATQKSGFDQRGLDGDVAFAFFQALGNVANAMTYVQANVPEQTDQRLQARVMGRIAPLRHQ